MDFVVVDLYAVVEVDGDAGEGDVAETVVVVFALFQLLDELFLALGGLGDLAAGAVGDGIVHAGDLAFVDLLHLVEVVGADKTGCVGVVAVHIDQRLEAVLFAAVVQPVDGAFLVDFHMVGVEAVQEIVTDDGAGAGALGAKCLGDESKVIFSPVLSKEEEHIDLNQDDEHILNQIRAFSDTPGAYVFLKGKKFKILKASYLNEQNEFGLLIKIGKNKLGIGLHSGTLVIETCQMEGKPVMDCTSFFNGQGRNLVGNIVE